MSTLIFDISEVAQKPGASQDISLDAEVAGLEVALARVAEGEPISLRLRAESIVEGVAVSGRVSGTLEMSCSRCVMEFRESFEHQVNEVFAFRPNEEEGDYPIQDDSIDVEPLVRDVVVLGISPKPLHSPECRGLCSVCGTNLNESDCGHDRRPVDIRWAPLRQLFAEGK